MIKRIFISFALLFFLTTCFAQNKTSANMEVIAYYSGSREDIDKYKVEDLTQIIFSFGREPLAYQ